MSRPQTRTQKQQGLKVRRALFIELAAVTAGLAIAGFIYIEGPSQSANYDVKILDAVGSPEGFTLDTKSQTIQSSPFGNLSARRAYTGNGTLAQSRAFMIVKLHAIGFKNAAWRNADGAAVAAGVLATCKDTAVFIRIDQPGDDPIDVEAWQANYADAPACPWL